METGKHREFFLPFCKGNGVDVGFGGGSKVVPDAVGIDWCPERAVTDPSKKIIFADGRKLDMFADKELDYVYSSHMLEDHPPTETNGILNEWLRAIKPGGYLCLLLPDEQRYRWVCKTTGQSYNGGHQVPEMSLQYIEHQFVALDATVVKSFVSFERQGKPDYNFGIVVKKGKWLKRVDFPFIQELLGFDIGDPGMVLTGTFDLRVLAGACFKYKPKVLLEIGTCLGHTAKFLARVCPESQIYTIDICQEMGLELPPEQGLETLKRENVGREIKGVDNVHQIIADSRTYDYNNLPKFDFVFIDGNHSLTSVVSDTRNVLSHGTDDLTIIWHDCKLETKVEEAVIKFSDVLNITAIKDTWCAIGKRKNL